MCAIFNFLVRNITESCRPVI